MISINILTVKQVKEREGVYDCPATLNSPAEVNRAIRAIFELQEEAVEKFGFFSLNTKNAITGAHIVSTGSLNQTIVHPREVFKAALLNNAAAIILFHNHPSGDTTPSKEDTAMTARLGDAGKLLGIPVLDHIIVSSNDYVSLKEALSAD